MQSLAATGGSFYTAENDLAVGRQREKAGLEIAVVLLTVPMRLAGAKLRRSVGRDSVEDPHHHRGGGRWHHRARRLSGEVAPDERDDLFSDEADAILAATRHHCV